MSYKRNISRSSFACSVPLAMIDTKLVTSVDGETTITDLDFSQQDSIHVDDMRISVLKENGMLGNLKPFSPVFDNLSVRDALSGAEKYIGMLTQKKQELEDLAKAEELDN